MLPRFSQPIIGPPLYPSTRSRVLNYVGKALFIITLLVVNCCGGNSWLQIAEYTVLRGILLTLDVVLRNVT
jgi:hypothetical protein